MEQDDVETSTAKRLVHDQVPRKIAGLKFGILTPDEIVNQSVLELSDRHLYPRESSGPERGLTQNGPLDPRMGVSSSTRTCETCKRSNKECNGHFGYIHLSLPAFHIGFFKKIIEVLHCICKDCGHVLLDERSRKTHVHGLRKSANDMQVKKERVKKVMAECRKCKFCPYCNSVNGTVRKVAGQALKIVHDQFRWFNASSAAKKKPPLSKVVFDSSFDTAKKTNPDIEKHARKALVDMNPLRVLRLFSKIPDVDCELLGMNAQQFRPEAMIWTHIPVPPVPIRPSVQQDSASTEDDITNKIGDIIHMSNLILAGLQSGQKVHIIMEQWDFLQIQVAMYINSEVPNLQQQGSGKMIRGFCQRLKGKQGRFRGNLSGKRVDFSGRTVISPDPNLSIDEVAVPRRVAENLSYPERVTEHNIERLRMAVCNGQTWPGANRIFKKAKRQHVIVKFLRKLKARQDIAQKLEIGDIVERHLIDGDIVLFNRQPSLHKLSIMCHRVKVREWRTFRLNECVCSPYNADFDGDEMNLHVPQTEEARAEALELMGVKYNLATPKNGTPIIAATQDFLTAAYLLSNKERFFDRSSFCQIVSFMFNAMPAEEPVSKNYPGRRSDGTALLDIEIPEPAIIKPRALWTGKQVFRVLMRPNKHSKVKVNFDAAGRNFPKDSEMPGDLNSDDQYVCVRNSELMCGVLDKNILGDGKKDSIFYVMMRDYGADVAVRAMNRLAKLAARWLSNEGFSIGISDVYPGQKLLTEKQTLIKDAYKKCDALIKECKDGKLTRDPGCDETQTMENRISGLLSSLRKTAGDICFAELSKWNSAVIMAQCGSKGSNLNVSQMVAAVGQQIIGGARVHDGFQDRSLPHFPKSAPQPPSKGFVSNSFFSGLSPTEFIFHAMSGREGLVDTAVKTAETGYMSRRLMKSLEDLAVSYDSSVRNSTKTIVQYQFGEDGLDPVDMEGKAKPVNFERTWLHARTCYWSDHDDALEPEQIRQITSHYLRVQQHHIEKGLEGAQADHMEAMRAFTAEVENFVNQKADHLAALRFQLQGFNLGRPGVTSNGTHLTQTPLWKDLAKVSDRSLLKFLRLCMHKYATSKVQPGHAVGAVGAQSIGEPGTQMTLKTFHFAGVAGMSITQGVPRIKEIINASKKISTPVIVCELENKFDDFAARCVKGAIEKTFLKDIIEGIVENWGENGCQLYVNISNRAVSKLALSINPRKIKQAILKTRGLKMEEESIKTSANQLIISVDDESGSGKGRRGKKGTEQELHFSRVQALRRQLPDVAISGHPDAVRAVISKTKKDKVTGIEPNQLLVEGYGLRQCMTTGGIVGRSCYTNNIDEMYSVLGVEAARGAIIKELQAVMGEQMDIDPRHMQLLADVMTYKGMILGITRFGLAKMRDSVLQLASFEKTPDHLFEAAVGGKVDLIEGVSECIIMGQSMKIGTGAMEVVRNMGWMVEDYEKRPTLFEDSCRHEERRRVKAKARERRAALRNQAARAV